jgi:hypothetical protein
MDAPTDIDNVGILGSEISRVDLDTAIKKIESLLSDTKKHFVVLPPVHTVLLARKDRELQAVPNAAELAAAGIPLIRASRLAKTNPRWRYLRARQVFHKVGLYDRKRLLHNGVHYVLCIGAHRAGFGLLVDYRCVVFVNVKSTGVRNEGGAIRWSDLGKSYFSRRSPNSIRYRWNFA